MIQKVASLYITGFLMLFSHFDLSAQTLSASGGYDSTKTSVTVVSWTLGEVVVSNEDISEGFQTFSDFSELVTAIQKEFGRTLKVYPNPAVYNLTIDFQNHPDKYNLALIDSSGRSYITESEIHRNKIILELKDLKSGIYFLKVTNTNTHKTKTFKIAKK